MIDQCAVIVFAKAPVPGYAKTRLAKVIGNKAAAYLASKMLNETVKQAVLANIGPVELCCDPDVSHQQFFQLRSNYGIVLSPQGIGDLGFRMSRAFERTLKTYTRVLLIGTDAPGLTANHLRDANNLLKSQNAVFAPAHDGGYVLVGLSRFMPTLFQGISWSTPEVMKETRARLDELDESCEELSTFFDVDEASDLMHVPAEWLLEIPDQYL
jgi:hypothetical protein